MPRQHASLALGWLLSCLSFALLAGVIGHWADLFVFSKVMHLPEWARQLPVAYHTPHYLVGASLLPALLAWRSLARTAGAGAVTGLAAPLAGLVCAPLFDPAFRHYPVLSNYIWILGFWVLAPAALLVTVRALCQLALRAVLR